MSDYKPEDLKKDIDYIKRNVSKHDVVLFGPQDSAESQGLIHLVSANTRYREFTVKLHWALLLMVAGLVANQIFELLNTLIS